MEHERIRNPRNHSYSFDVFLNDFKYIDGADAERYSGAKDYPVVAFEALDAMLEVAGKPRFDECGGQKRLIGGVIVRHLMLPQSSDGKHGGLEASISVVKALWERYGDKVLYSIMNQYTPVLPDIAQKKKPFEKIDDSFAAGAKRIIERCPELTTRVSEKDYEALLTFADEIGIPEYFWQTGQASADSFIPVFDNTGV